MKAVLPFLTACALSCGAVAGEQEAKLTEMAHEQLARIVSDPAVIAAIKEQNEMTLALDAGQIEDLDLKWRSEIASQDRPTIEPVLTSTVSELLRELRNDSDGLLTEVFVMDAVGLNVGASDVTSDYWQGDEAKWQETFLVGAGSVHISDVELDESTQTFQRQVSVPITAGEDNQLIGAVTFGVNVDAIE